MKCFYECDKPATVYVRARFPKSDPPYIYAALCDDHEKIQKTRHAKITKNEFLASLVMNS